MKPSALIIIVLLILSLGLGIALMSRGKRAADEVRKTTDHLVQLSNTVVQTRVQLEEHQAVNLALESNLAARATEVGTLSNSMATLSANLAKAQAEAAAAAEAAARTTAEASAELAKRDAEIAELQGQNDDMTKRLLELNNNISSLEQQIATTEQKLATSEGDREFLLAELQRLQNEKAELEKQFHDLAVLREQVRHLKQELSVARRLDWLRRGIYGSHAQKGGERLVQGVKPPSPPRPPADLDLDVEIKQDGSAKVQTPAPDGAPQ